ncbi:hypothetical protein BDR26DRAFT_868152 [Obelidium mucronatum]|nr:hypothetical protein BDR26DRAFT_868152 [Obelidium mucronatum]
MEKAQQQDPLILLRHDMAPRNPYDSANSAAHCQNPPPDHSHPRTTLITELPPTKLVYPPPPQTAQDRNLRRYENTRGTLGGNVNFDGTNRDKPMISMELYQLKQQQQQKSASNPELIYFGSGANFQQQQKRDSFRHGPGIMSALYSESESNLQKKRAIQQEMAMYERMQMEERDRRRHEEKHQHNPPKDNWPFGKQIGHGADHLKYNHTIPLRQEEVALRQHERSLAQEYAKELDNQIANNRQFQAQARKEAPVRDDDTKWMFHHSHMPGRRPKVPFEPPRDQGTDLISHVTISNKGQADPTRKLKPPPNEERKDVFPFNHDQYNNSHPVPPSKPPPPTEPTSLTFSENTERLNRRVSFSQIDKAATAQDQPQHGRRRFQNESNNAENIAAEREIKLMRKIQEEELRQRRETQEKHRQEEYSQGKIYAQSYPWKWGDGNETRKEHPHHKATDIIMQKEPINKSKALQYQIDLDAMVMQKREMNKRERQLDTELWNKHIQNSFENSLGKPRQVNPRYQHPPPKRGNADC